MARDWPVACVGLCVGRDGLLRVVFPLGEPQRRAGSGLKGKEPRSGGFRYAALGSQLIGVLVGVGGFSRVAAARIGVGVILPHGV